MKSEDKGSTFISHRSADDIQAHLKPVVLVIVTGGTICMRHTGINASLKPTSVADHLLAAMDLTDTTFPDVDILEWTDLTDSSEINLDHWVRIAKDIEQRYHGYDGFVVLHGTDTLSYTASALSFMLENVSKPVILTGSMLPIFHGQTDARKNLVVALTIAAYSQMTEVCVLFGSRLLRGNRSRKVHCSEMDAFNSPNFPSLGRVGVDVTIDDRLFLSPSKRGFRVFPHFCMNIVVVTVTPGFQTSILRHLLSSPTRPLAVMLELYGTGTAPVSDGTLLAAIQAGIQDGIEIVCLTQCTAGACSLRTYENGAVLHRLGVIEGKDLTPEAAFAKLAYLMGKGYSGVELRMLMERDIRGEITETPVKLTGQASLHLHAHTPVTPYVYIPTSSIEKEDRSRTDGTLEQPVARTADQSVVRFETASSVQEDFPTGKGVNPSPLVLTRTVSSPALHAEMHLDVHTLKAELDHYGRSHCEVADHKKYVE